jgi:hypothetical protein
MSGASAGGSECRGLVLKLHLQKHYLLKNYTSRDLEIILDPNETFVELMPKDDPDALRMLRHADAQVTFCDLENSISRCFSLTSTRNFCSAL